MTTDNREQALEESYRQMLDTIKAVRNAGPCEFIAEKIDGHIARWEDALSPVDAPRGEVDGLKKAIEYMSKHYERLCLGQKVDMFPASEGRSLEKILTAARLYAAQTQDSGRNEGWQDISTAPKTSDDFFLVCGVGDPRSPFVMRGDILKTGRRKDCPEHLSAHWLTHWMPLPKASTTKPEGE